jgi:hypothetical protein
MVEDDLKESLFESSSFFYIFDKVFHPFTELVGGLFLDFEKWLSAFSALVDN